MSTQFNLRSQQRVAIILTGIYDDATPADVFTSATALIAGLEDVLH